MGKNRILILGGTTESRQLAQALAERGDVDPILSLAGRTAEPRDQKVPTRIGGFGGAEGLARFLAEERIDLLIDATHPFAIRISANAVQAIKTTGIPGFALCRPAWEAVAGDRWTRVTDIPAAVAALGTMPRRVFFAIGRQEAFHVEAAPQHHYLVRSVDPVVPPLALPDVAYVLATGPFSAPDEIALLQDRQIDIVVAKNSGGQATYGKIAAARALGLPVIMIERQTPGNQRTAGTVGEALALVDHLLSPDRKRGV